VSDALTLEQTAARLGAYAWLQERLFEVVGGWAATVPEAEVRIVLGVHADHHAWHARLWRERIPRVHTVDADAVVAPAHGADAVVDALRAAEGTVERLAGTYRAVVPALVATFGEHRRAASPLADGPVVRALELAGRDLVADWAEGDALLRLLVRTRNDVARAATASRAVEELLVDAGPPA
jgi:hypothetical protein